MIRRLLAVAATAVAVAGCLTAAPAAAAYTFGNLSFNLCGNKCNDGRLAVADEVVDSIINRNARTATLQEVCAGQANRIRNQLASRDYQVVHVPTAHKCDDGSDYGIALVTRGTRDWHKVWSLPNPNGHEPRKMVCAMLSPQRFIACSTHIDFHGDGTRGAQVDKVADILAGYAAAGHPAFVGGDFNLTPTEDALDVMYRPAYGGGATGAHTEANGCCSRSGPATGDGGAKIDYVFMKAPAFTPNASSVVSTPNSDHKKLWTNMTLN
ncbi:endonuclease/exonuclease/phosphatase family protein [Kribbella sandramycini]|uniref:Endonuclease/exonuclease/phosphatase family metal-dependent hydrolase n=1 Tax=Kribbella sandramycini TaxID=60450 RepID=A0A7Y4KVT3_9ACTN|nr:endonuclease/exonuclease/phosphatase family protein [Kribbella sandramycini]MBB6567813.1 endonuclease/exonuclease/phosphatase family metal-dependent hydrolase [Kribbella sandramycini]NOL39592.1 endonuclease/exonuclease/phosphatase family protein [Kribbella sandramycini]